MRSLALLAAIATLSAAHSAYAQGAAPQSQPQAAPQTVAVDSEGSGAIPSIALPVQTSNGVNFMNGGIGDEELADLKSHANELNVHVLLTAPRGEYVSDIALRLLDNKDAPLVSLAAAGPYFYAHVPPGTYFIETTSKSQPVAKRFKIAVKGNEIVRQQIVYDEADTLPIPHAPTVSLK